MTEINTNIESLKKILKKISEYRKKEISFFNTSGLDPITIRHCKNTMALMVNLSIDKDFETISNIAMGALLHDIGKADSIIKPLIEKPGKLTDKEFTIVKNHTTLGYNKLKEFRIENQIILDISQNHHLRSDGKGYPSTSPNYPINDIIQLFSIVDSYEAITSQDRIYQHRSAPHNAMRDLRKDCIAGIYGKGALSNFELFEESLKRIGVIKNPMLCPILIEDYMEISIF